MPDAPVKFNFFRTLRFRLASTFLLLVTLLLAAVGVVGTLGLRLLLENQNEQTLRAELTALKGYIYFDQSNSPRWFVDHDDPDDVAELTRLRQVFVLARPDGRIFDATDDRAFDKLVSPTTIRGELAQIHAARTPLLKTIAADENGPYRVIASSIPDLKQQEWYLAVGHSLKQSNQLLSRFRRAYLIFFPLAVFFCTLASWYSAGRALRTLGAVEHAAQDITGSNLGLQIPLRGAGDELDRLIGSFNEMSRRLKASFDQIRQFSTDVSHELRTPLTAIQGQLEVALFTAQRPEQLREAIENALQDVERLSNLIRALLLISQAETGQLPMVKTTLDIAALVTGLVDQFQIPAEVKGIRLVYKGDSQVWCEADRTQIERVVTNILSNAIKYTPEGGLVEASARAERKVIHIVVADTGVGISPDHLPHIFDRFYRVPHANPEKGLGLGLSFVASIVKAHGGNVIVNSLPGEGTTVEVRLPVGRVRQPVAAEPAGANLPRA